MEVTRGAFERLLAEAKAAAPNEACGLLLGHRGHIEAVVLAQNVHPDPATHFEIDPQALIDAHRAARSGGPEVIGYYHSHPTGGAEPSPADIAGAENDGKVWAIVANGTVRFWRAGDGGFDELPTGVHNR
ncbi:peptidase [Altererythrobacter salegens]|uniref:Peptidase n=1 Tax=Croceibacterium salegens TaxID=1737568 RepID=A0A6I4SQK7_9SPHN|nr:peptidase [Croceibacterium salegens]